MHISLVLMHCRLFWSVMWKSAWQYCAESRIWGLVYSSLSPDPDIHVSTWWSRWSRSTLSAGSHLSWSRTETRSAGLWTSLSCPWCDLNKSEREKCSDLLWITLKRLWTPSSICTEVYSYQNICKYIGLKWILTALDELKWSVHCTKMVFDSF